MTGAETLALADAALTLWEHAATQLQEARKKGLITAEEQAERMARVESNRSRVGLPPPGL